MYKVIIDLREINEKTGQHNDITYDYPKEKDAKRTYKKIYKRWKRGGVFELPNVYGIAIHSSDVLHIRFGKGE